MTTPHDRLLTGWQDADGALHVVLPHPPASLSPNGRPNRWQKARDAKQVRRDAALLTRQAIWEQRIDSHPWDAARLDICWLFAGTQPDADNVVARCKSVVDGIADMGIVANDQVLRLGAVTFRRVKRTEQAVMVTITREERQHDTD